MVTSCTNTRQRRTGSSPTGVTVMSCSRDFFDRVCKGRSEGLMACVTIVEVLDVRAALTAKCKRVNSVPGKISASVRPFASSSVIPDANSNHAFQLTTRALWSSTTSPPLMASNTVFWSILSSVGIRSGGMAAGGLYERRQQVLQRRKRRQIEQHRNVAGDVGL